MPADCRIVSCRPLIVPPSHHLVAPAGCRITSPRPPIAPPSCRLVAPAGCCIASRRPLIAPPSRQLVKPACRCITSPCPLSAPHTALSSSRHAGWLFRRLLMCHPLVILSSCHLVVPPLIVSLRQLVVAPSSLVVLLLHRPLVLSSCWLVVALPVLAPPSHPLVVVHRPRHRTPSNAAAAIEHHCHRRHRTPSLSSTAATAAVHRHHQTPIPTFVHHRCQTLTPTIATRHR